MLALDDGRAYGLVAIGVPLADDGFEFFPSAHLGRIVGFLSYELLLHELRWREVRTLPNDDRGIRGSDLGAAQFVPRRCVLLDV